MNSVTIIVAISVAPRLIDKGERTTLIGSTKMYTLILKVIMT